MVKFLFNLNINQNFVKQLMAIIAALGPTNTGMPLPIQYSVPK